MKKRIKITVDCGESHCDGCHLLTPCPTGAFCAGLDSETLDWDTESSKFLRHNACLLSEVPEVEHSEFDRDQLLVDALLKHIRTNH